MSDNLEELLASVDAEIDDYDLADDEEDALLEGNFENDVSENRLATDKVEEVAAKGDQEVDPDSVLELDDGTESNDEEEDSEIQNTIGLSFDDDQEKSRETDKFANERVVPIAPISLQRTTSQNITNTFPPKHNQQNNQFRGRDGGKGNIQYPQNRNQHFQQKKVLINPHFKGNVQMRNNVSLAWDNNQSKNNGLTQHRKPFGCIQPWVQSQQPVAYNFAQPPQHLVNPNLFSNLTYPPVQQMNTKPSVHQRLGINPNFSQVLNPNLNQVFENQQFIQPVQHQSYPQIPQNQVPNQVFDQPSPFINNFNNVQPQFNNSHMYQNKFPLYNQPPVFNDQPAFPNQLQNNFNTNYNNYQPPIQPQSTPAYLPPCNNSAYQNINSYPQTIPVQNIDSRRVIQSVNFQNSEYSSNQGQYHHLPRIFNQGSPGKRKFDNIKVDLKKKKRNQLFTNLHEVPTVDTLVTIQNTKVELEEEEDEEMKAYRLKIQQQKLIRERILHQKEERRKQAAKKMQAEEEYKTVVPPTALIKNIEIPVIANVNMQSEVTIKNNLNKRPQIATCVNRNIVPIKTVNIADSKTNNVQVIKRVVTQNVTGTRVIVPLKDVSATDESSDLLNKDHLSSFLSNRKIFAKDQSLVDTSVVVVNNLATGTSAAKLRKLCQGVGEVQTLQMSTQERQATIQFKSVASAHAFYKKYQRFMLDLSMIQVTLKPMS